MFMSKAVKFAVLLGVPCVTLLAWATQVTTALEDRDEVGPLPVLFASGKNPGHPALAFRREVVCTGKVVRATLAVVGLGVYEAKVNGCRVGEDELSPGYTSDRVRQRVVYDVTANLRDGTNTLEVTTADSYWRDWLATYFPQRHPNGISAVLTLTDAGGTRTIRPDGDWRVSDSGPLVSATIYEGETYDARNEDAAVWRQAVVSKLDVRTVPSRGLVYVRNDRVSAAKAPFEIRPGERKVVDFGQNCAGREAFTVRGARGTTVRIRHAEVLNPDGTCYFDNLRKAKATTVYTLKGGEAETYRPRFTYYGFRYVEISADGPVVFEALRQEPLSSVTVEKESGSIRTSDADINKIISCAEWSLRSNQLSVPTDCAQRDERQPWIGDALTAVPATCWLWDARDFYAKSLRDQRDVQKPDGRFSSIAPGNPGWMSEQRYGAVGWADTGILMPYAVWKHFGDTAELVGHYDSMVRYADWILRANGPSNYGWGDWLSFQRTGFGLPKWPYASDPDTFAFLVHAYRIMDLGAISEIAAKLGKAADATRYAAARDHALAKARKELLKSDGTMDPKYVSQTMLAIALTIGLCPDGASRQKTMDELVRSIRDAGGRLMTGILGTAFLMNALSEGGQAKCAYDLLLNRTCPSWLYMVDRGATTLWEHWDGIQSDGSFFSPTMNSFNHAEFASVLDWMYRTMAGIRPNPKDGGFDDFVLQPQPDARIRTVEATYRTPKGVIRVRSHYDSDGKWSYDYELPPGTSATLILPGKDPVRVRQN